MELGLDGQVILTEAASDEFACTALAAAMTGAEHVYAVTRDSRYGTAKEVIEWNKSLARQCGVSEKITYSTDTPLKYAAKADIVTNLGFVRPINKPMIEVMSPTVSIALMWEPWEYREADLDLSVAQIKGIPVAGTKEDHPHLKTMEYLGDLALKLIEEARNIDDLSVCIIGSYPFGAATQKSLKEKNVSAVLNPPDYSSYNCIVLVENIDAHPAIDVQLVKQEAVIIHIAGVIDDNALRQRHIKKYPDISVGPHQMTLTTAYASQKAVIDLHTAGLKVGSIMNHSMRKEKDTQMAIQAAVDSGYGAAIGHRFPKDYMLE